LSYATILSPRDPSMRIRLTRELLRQNKLADAKAAIEPLAFYPHGGQTQRNKSYQVLTLIESGKGAEALAIIDKDMMPKPEDDNA
jgi:hypothetical protein